ncbi:MAG TPA: protein kinase [Vicinamibacterales bacterium]|nr:protein kinase [Vicinamibacterales bacterium]
MTLTPGARLGPYEIVSELGAGGMGEVYKAVDTRLDRTVAIKILLETLAVDAQSRERFKREARAISQLTHPHICTLFDVGEQEGTAFLVMEYLDGETVAERLKKGALPLEYALTVAIQIADALSTAHRHGIVHRDLKPGNVMLLKAGAKLLDFGLAKSKAPVVATSAISMLPTMPPTLTAQGAILGTFQYMAPEQIEGLEADARTDIFAFGCTLYEMLTGRRLHEGLTDAGVIAAILRSEVPSLIRSQPSVPPFLDWMVRRCLAKQPDERWQTATDVAAALRWIAGTASQAATTAPSRAGRFGHVGWGLAAAAWVALAAIGIWTAMRPSMGGNISAVHLAIQLPSNLPLATGYIGRTTLAISPDATRIAYLCQAGEELRQICLRSIDAVEVTPLRGTGGATTPFFSPDGAWLGFHANGKLQRIAITGGAPMILGDANAVLSADWAADDTIVYAPDTSSALFRIPAAGGTAVRVTTLDSEAGEWTHQWPDVLPNGGILYVRGFGPTFDEFDVCVFSPRTGQSAVLIPGATFPRYAASGHLVFWQRGTLLAAPFDANRLELTGTAVPVVEGVAGLASEGFALFALSESGSLVYERGDPHGGKRRLLWVDRTGGVQQISAPSRAYGGARISPDGRRLAIMVRDPQLDVWVYDFPLGTLARLTFDAGAEESPVWSPDGKWITYTASRPGGWQTLRRAADGSGGEELLFEYPHHQHWGSWTPDGKTLALGTIDPKTGSDIVIGSLGSPRSLRPLIRTPLAEDFPAFSPDGRWIAYGSQESGRYEVYVQAYPGPGGKWQVSADGGTDPRWAKGGRELFYRNGDRVIGVAVETTPAFRVSGVLPLFEGRHPRVTFETGWDVTPDGQRFLMIRDEDQNATPQLDVVLNWSEELKRRVPIK